MSSNMPQPDPIPGSSHTPETAAERSRGTDPSVGYEVRDVAINTILWFGLAVVIGTGLVMWGLYGMTNLLNEQATQNDPRLSPLADTQQIAPEPRLQAYPERDLAAFLSSQEEKLNSYAWVDRQAGIVQIPVDRAMDLLLERGLPTPKGNTDTQQQGEATENGAATQGDAPAEQPSDRPTPENR